MNILFFLKPKETLCYLKKDYTLRQALEKMEQSKFTAVPVIDDNGMYAGTLSVGDILWYIKDNGQFDLVASEKIKISNITRYRDNTPIRINQNIEDLIKISKEENFVPVIDDRNFFIGIVTRQDIIDYFYKKQIENEKLE